MKALAFVFSAIILALVFPILYGMTSNEWFLLGLIPAFPAVFYLQYKAIQIIRHEFTDSQQTARPDVAATRQWVDDLLNKKMANTLQIGGITHNAMQHEIKRLKTILLENDGYRALSYCCTESVSGCPHMIGTLWQGSTFVARISGGALSDGGFWRGFEIHAANDDQWKQWTDTCYDVACNGPGWQNYEHFVSSAELSMKMEKATEDGLKWEFVTKGGNLVPKS